MALLVPGLLLVSSTPTASAAVPDIGRVTVSGTDILVDGQPSTQFFGVVDTTALAFAIDAYINGNTGVAGWSSVFNVPDTGTHVPVTPHDTADAFWNQYFAQMKYYGVNLVRIGAGDTWGTGLQYEAWMNHRDQYYALLHSMSYYAQMHGVWLAFVVAGSQEYPTYQFGTSGSVFDPSSPAFANYVTYSRATMGELENENAIAMFDMFNEPDHNNCNANYWQNDKAKFNNWANAVADATAGASTHPRTLGIAGFGNLFGMSQEDFNWSAGHTGFEILHRHYYAANTDPNNFVLPEQWADAVNKPLFWGELGYNGVYPLTRYTFGEETIYANGGQAITSMVLTGTSGYPYYGGAVGEGQVPMPADWPQTPTTAPTTTKPVSKLTIGSAPVVSATVGSTYEYQVETSEQASIWVSSNADFLGFNQFNGKILGTPGTPGSYEVSVKAYTGSSVAYQNYTLVVAPDPSKGEVAISANMLSADQYQFGYGGSLDGTSAASVSWDFGDGSVSNETSPVHTFAPGTYLVNLTVTTQGGNEVRTSYGVEVNGTQNGASGDLPYSGALIGGMDNPVLVVVGLVAASIVGLFVYACSRGNVNLAEIRFRGRDLRAWNDQLRDLKATVNQRLRELRRR